MTLAYEIIDCRAAHIAAIAPLLRPGDLAEVEATGLTPKRALFNSYRRSHIARTFIVDGQVAAVGGCTGTLLSPVGHPWLMTSMQVEKVKFTFVREGRRELEKLFAYHSVLRNYVAARYVRAIGLLDLLGFTILPEDQGLRVGETKELFLKFEMTRA